jgi:hypothetical protein
LLNKSNNTLPKLDHTNKLKIGFKQNDKRNVTKGIKKLPLDKEKTKKTPSDKEKTKKLPLIRGI